MANHDRGCKLIRESTKGNLPILRIVSPVICASDVGISSFVTGQKIEWREPNMEVYGLGIEASQHL